MSDSRRLGFVCSALLALACARLPGAPDASAPLGRLPGDVRPVRYELELAIDPTQRGFSGSAAIDVALERSVQTIWLHGMRLAVRAATIELDGGEPHPARWEPAAASGVVALRLAQPLGPGAARLRVAYDAEFDASQRGIYRVEADGESYAFTHFEPLAARRAFPGFDEPAFKTPFDVALVVPQDHVAVGNTPVAEDTALPDGRRRIRFATSQPLPTHLVAWAVGPLDAIEAPPLRASSIRPRSVPVRGIALRGRGPALAEALARTPALVESLEAYFAAPYPYAKLDLIAVPDFGPGAMENAGAVFFREEYLMLGGADAPQERRRRFGYVMAHELAHQWFGNLVTMTWWDDLWLSEAFATWLGRRIERAVFPENAADLSFLEAVHRAMREDSRAGAQSIRRPVEDPRGVYGVFDAITYDKGAGVLAMFEHWLGPEVFRAGIRRFLAENRSGSASGADLLRALSQAAGRDVGTPFRSFLLQPGVPLLAFERACDASGGGVRVRQSRHLPLGVPRARSATWEIPVCIRHGAGGEVRESCELVREREARIALGDDCPGWLAPNAEAAGYYRSALAPDDWRDLRLRGWKHLGAGERLSLADDLEAAFRAGAAAPEAVFGGLETLAADADPRVARVPMSLLRLARDHLVAAEQRKVVERFGAALYAPRLRRLGWETSPGEGADATRLREELAGFLALEAREPGVRGEAARRGRRYAGLDGAAPDASALAPELVETALAVVVQDGGARDFDALLALLGRTEDPATRRVLLRALASTRDPALAARARALSLDPALRASEVWTPLYRQSQQASTRDAAWSWVEEHFDALVERAGRRQSGWMPWLAAGQCDAASADAVAASVEPRLGALAGGRRNLEASLEAIRACAAVAAQQGPGTARFFAGLR